MKIRADEHVSLPIVFAIREIALSEMWEMSSVYESNDRGKGDAYWITKFSLEGGGAILSADKDFIKHPPQISAVFDTGVKVIHLPPRWANAKGALQAAHILLWWPRIEATLGNMKQRECYTPPWNLKETGQLKKVTIDYAKAQKKVRKANRRPAK